MFKFDAEPTFASTVFIARPGGGGTSVRITYRHVVGEDYNKLLAEHGGNPPALLHALIADWDTNPGPKGEWEGMEQAYSLEALTDLHRKQPRALRSMLAAYAFEVTGAIVGN